MWWLRILLRAQGFYHFVVSWVNEHSKHSGVQVRAGSLSNWIFAVAGGFGVVQITCANCIGDAGLWSLDGIHMSIGHGIANVMHPWVFIVSITCAPHAPSAFMRLYICCDMFAHVCCHSANTVWKCLDSSWCWLYVYRSRLFLIVPMVGVLLVISHMQVSPAIIRFTWAHVFFLT